MIMKKIIYTVILAAAVLTGCKKVTPELPTGLQLKVTTDDTFVDKIVKSGASADINTFSVEIVKKDGKFSNTWLYGELPSLVELSVGEYTVTVKSPESVKVNWESPVYGGSMDFAILDGVVTPLDVVCTLQNMKNSVYCSENLIRSLSTFEVKVANADGFLVWSSGEVGVYSQSGDGTKTIIKEPAKQAYFSNMGAIIKDSKLVEKKKIALPERITNVIFCKNPRCITTTEQELPHVFRLTDEHNRIYRCLYCEAKAERKK